MDIADRDRLTKLVGMLGSDQLGERANAAAFIQRLADKYKLSVAELMATAFAKPAPPPPPPPRQPPPRQQQWSRPPPPPPPPPPPKQQRQQPTWSSVGTEDKMLRALRHIVDNEARFEFTLNSWEWQFTEDVSNRYDSDDELSDKQKNIIERIVTKCSKAMGG